MWDKKTETIVNNESSEIIRFMNTAFNDQIDKERAELDLYPEDKAVRNEIDEQNDWVYNTVRNKACSDVFILAQRSDCSFGPSGEQRKSHLSNFPLHSPIAHACVGPLKQGVYKSGFATTQKAYENNVIPLFESLDRLEKMLEGGKEFVAGDKLTEADVRLYTTLVSRLRARRGTTLFSFD